MRNDKDFISDHLVNIRDRLKVYSKEQTAAESAASPATRSPDNQEPVRTDKERYVEHTAIKRRIADAGKSRAELEELLAGDIAYIKQRIRLEREQLRELEAAEENIRRTPEHPAGSSPAEAGAYFRSIEAVRLEYIRCIAKYSNRSQEEQQLARSRENGGGFPNYFAGQVKAGAAFNLVLAVSVILASVIAGIFFFAAINGGF